MLITEPGEASFIGETSRQRIADLVAVYVTPAARGTGVIQALLDAAAEWALTQEVPKLQLFVHAQNLRAQRAYAKSGFAFTGESATIDESHELKMTRPLRAPTAD